MTREGFEKLVRQALAELPEAFRARLQNVEIAVEEEPTAEQLESVGLREDELLLGLYVGTPLTERSSDYGMVMPDRILLFQGDIEQVCASHEEIAEEVRKTVIHEVAHFFGLGEEDIPDWAR